MKIETNTAIDVAGMHQKSMGSRPVALRALRQRDEDYQLYLRACGYQKNLSPSASVFGAWATAGVTGERSGNAN